MDEEYIALLDNTNIHLNGTDAVKDTQAIGETIMHIPDPDIIIGVYIIPIVAMFGLFGNVINFMLLLRRLYKLPVSNLERCSLCGLICLAITDFFFCLSVVPELFEEERQIVYCAYSFKYYYHLYGIFAKELFLKVSISLTMIIGVSRCIVVCYPLKARFVIKLKTTLFICAAAFFIWLLLLLPLLWMHDVIIFNGLQDTIMYIVTEDGAFNKNKRLNLAFSMIWSCIGFALPMIVLLACNIKLIQALRKSLAFRSRTLPHYTSITRSHNILSVTLVVLIILLFLMVSPSEIFHFILEFLPHDNLNYEAIRLGSNCVNLLQTIYLSSHFILYIIVNPTFREDFRKLVGHVMCRRSMREGSVVARTNSRRSTLSSNTAQSFRGRMYTATKLSRAPSLRRAGKGKETFV